MNTGARPLNTSETLRSSEAPKNSADLPPDRTELLLNMKYFSSLTGARLLNVIIFGGVKQLLHTEVLNWMYSLDSGTR